MGKDYKDLFNLARRHTDIPPALLGVVMKRICREETFVRRRELFLVGGTAVLSFLAIIPAFIYLSTGFLQSGFYQYFSLVFTDGLNVMLYWREILMSLLESLPVFSITVFLSLLLVFLWSAGRTSRSFGPRLFINLSVN